MKAEELQKLIKDSPSHLLCYQAGRKEVVEFVDNLIIGVEGCKFEERLDGDKGCIVLDMNDNRWKAKRKEWGIKCSQ
jgi:hypothetical protein